MQDRTKLTEDDRRQLRSLMYQDDGEPTSKPDIHIDPAGFMRTRKIWVGAIGYEVPTPEYISRLELLVQHQARTIDQLSQQIHKLQRFMSGTRKFIKGQTKHITEIKQELDNKVDERE